MRISTPLLCCIGAAQAAVNIDWNAGFTDPAARNMTAPSGAILNFTWEPSATLGNVHNVYRLASKSAFDSCNFTGASDLGSGTAPASVLAQPTDLDGSNAAYYACRVFNPLYNMDHCQGGQKLSVYFDSPAANPTAAPTPTISSASALQSSTAAVLISLTVAVAATAAGR
jgi:hypothetical protein